MSNKALIPIEMTKRGVNWCGIEKKIAFKNEQEFIVVRSQLDLRPLLPKTLFGVPLTTNRKQWRFQGYPQPLQYEIYKAISLPLQ